MGALHAAFHRAVKTRCSFSLLFPVFALVLFPMLVVGWFNCPQPQVAGPDFDASQPMAAGMYAHECVCVLIYERGTNLQQLSISQIIVHWFNDHCARARRATSCNSICNPQGQWTVCWMTTSFGSHNPYRHNILVALTMSVFGVLTVFICICYSPFAAAVLLHFLLLWID